MSPAEGEGWVGSGGRGADLVPCSLIGDKGKTEGISGP